MSDRKPVLTPPQAKAIELALDIAATLTIGYLLWTLLFHQKPVDPIEGVLPVQGMLAIGWGVWKYFRSKILLKGG